MDAIDLVKASPIKKNASTVQIIALFILGALVFAGGWWASSAVKRYFDSSHGELLAAIAKVDGDQTLKVAAISNQVDKNTAAIDGIRRWSWSNSDQSHYMNEFYRDNVKAFPSLIVPEVPPPQVVR